MIITKKTLTGIITGLFLTSCTVPQQNVTLWSLKQFRDARITLFDINKDGTQDLIVSGYQKGGKVDLKKMLFIESDLKTYEAENGKWQERGYSFYLDKKYQLWVKYKGKSEKVKNNVFRSTVSAVLTDDNKLEILHNGEKVKTDKNSWSIDGLSLWVDKSDRLWINENGVKTIAPRKRWKRKLSVAVNSSSEWIKGTGYKRGGKVDENKIPIGDSVAAVDGKTQNILWTFQTGDSVENYPSIYENKVYIGGYDRNIYALDLFSGKIDWFFSTNSPVRTNVAVADKIAYFANSEGTLYAVTSEKGGYLWSFKAKAGIETSPAIYDGKIYFGSWDKHLYCLDNRTGRLIWKQKLPSYIGKSSPIIYQDKVIFGAWDRNVYALDAYSGRVEWTFKTDDWIDKGSPAIGNGYIYIGNKSGNVYAINASTGIMKWQYSTGDAITASPVISKNRIYVTSRDGYLYALSPSNGNLIWENRTRFKIFGSPAIAQNRVYFSSMGGYLTSIVDTSMGKAYWPMFGGDPSHKREFITSSNYGSKLNAKKTEVDKLLEENGLKQK